ncbi:MAG: DEAD/DEAH box helicase [Alphaproteobacteria bacterium]|nr:MAG: DEAD/DEAH box helicase [Alphaproteobacteria bacterium]
MTGQFTTGELVRARGREWVVLPETEAGWLRLRPLSGAEEEGALILSDLEPVEPARFDLPENAMTAIQPVAELLARALRLSLRRGAGPFRSAARLNFEPRAYQLVPMLMALRLEVPRLLIADDVGIGKTIEAGLILRELIDRGEADSFTILCPPHLVEQWTRELADRFGLDAVAVTAASARRLERGLPASVSLFDMHPRTVVSLDYIKAEKRRQLFERGCSDFVIVDEAHACVGQHHGRQQRFRLLQALAKRPERALILLTATPHSGDEDAFARLLGLLHEDFAGLHFEDEGYRVALARHFVQRRRVDLEGDDWGEARAFPKHLRRDLTYRLTPAQQDFIERVLDYCFAVVERAGTGERDRRLAFWGTLALMRCIGSSPRAALQTLRTRAGLSSEAADAELFDEDGTEEAASDVEPGFSRDDDPELASLIREAEALSRAEDPKLDALISEIGSLRSQGFKSIVFCRYISTAEHVGAGLRGAFPKARVEVVTGLMTPDERRARITDMADAAERILVATDCLSEGINLQELFSAVIHYDLTWNPTRLQQREGRVDRFGQPSPEVRSVLMYSPDNPVDGAVLDVILRKADAIRRATGVVVPLPEETGPVTDALIRALALKRAESRQLELFAELENEAAKVEDYWSAAEAQEKRSRSRFAQRTIKPAKVIGEWKKAQALVGGPAEAASFTRRALARLNAPPSERQGLLEVALRELPLPLRERLEDEGLTETLRLALNEPAPAGSRLLSRAHPLVQVLAEGIVEAALEPQALPGVSVGRLGAWPSRAVGQLTPLALLRLRFTLRDRARARRGHLLLAEEAALVALGPDGSLTTHGEEAWKLLAAEPAGDVAPAAVARLVARAREALNEALEGPIREFAEARSQALAEDHTRVRQAAGGGAGLEVKALMPPDVIGLFVLAPEMD